MMEKHYLTSLFTPGSVIVLAGDPDAPESQTPQARALLDGLKAQKFTGTLQFFDINTSGTLADLAQIRADLAIIVQPNKDLPAALEIAGRMNCRAALVLSNGVDAELAGQLHKIARREGMHLLGPNSLGIQRPSLQLNASAAAIRARVKGSGTDAYDDHQALNVPRLRAALQADYSVPGVAGLALLGGVRYSASKYANYAGTVETGGYTVFDIGRRYRARIAGYDTQL